MSQTILTMSLLPFWALNMSVALMSMQGQKALRFHQKYLNLCSKDERRSHGFETTSGKLMTSFFIFGWTITLSLYPRLKVKRYSIQEQMNLLWILRHRHHWWLLYRLPWGCAVQKGICCPESRIVFCLRVCWQNPEVCCYLSAVVHRCDFPAVCGAVTQLLSAGVIKFKILNIYIIITKLVHFMYAFIYTYSV